MPAPEVGASDWVTVARPVGDTLNFETAPTWRSSRVWVPPTAVSVALRRTPVTAPFAPPVWLTVYETETGEYVAVPDAGAKLALIASETSAPAAGASVWLM